MIDLQLPESHTKSGLKPIQGFEYRYQICLETIQSQTPHSLFHLIPGNVLPSSDISFWFLLKKLAVYKDFSDIWTNNKFSKKFEKLLQLHT